MQPTIGIKPFQQFTPGLTILGSSFAQDLEWTGDLRTQSIL
jgi:hypothetical protein